MADEGQTPDPKIETARQVVNQTLKAMGYAAPTDEETSQAAEQLKDTQLATLQAYLANIKARAESKNGVSLSSDEVLEERQKAVAANNPTEPDKSSDFKGFDSIFQFVGKYVQDHQPRPPAQPVTPAEQTAAPVQAPEPPPKPSLPEAKESYEFVTGSAVLTDGQKQQIAKLAEQWKNGDNKDKKILVEGHTDTVGTVAYNDGLALRRAQAVQAELVRLHVPAGNIQIAKYGKNDRDHQIEKTGDNVPRAKNRAAVMSFVPASVAAAAAGFLSGPSALHETPVLTRGPSRAEAEKARVKAEEARAKAAEAAKANTDAERAKQADLEKAEAQKQPREAAEKEAKAKSDADKSIADEARTRADAEKARLDLEKARSEAEAAKTAGNKTDLPDAKAREAQARFDQADAATFRETEAFVNAENARQIAAQERLAAAERVRATEAEALRVRTPAAKPADVVIPDPVAAPTVVAPATVSPATPATVADPAPAPGVPAGSTRVAPADLTVPASAAPKIGTTTSVAAPVTTPVAAPISSTSFLSRLGNSARRVAGVLGSTAIGGVGTYSAFNYANSGQLTQDLKSGNVTQQVSGGGIFVLNSALGAGGFVGMASSAVRGFVGRWAMPAMYADAGLTVAHGLATGNNVEVAGGSGTALGMLLGARAGAALPLPGAWKGGAILALSAIGGFVGQQGMEKWAENIETRNKAFADNGDRLRPFVALAQTITKDPSLVQKFPALGEIAGSSRDFSMQISTARNPEDMRRMVGGYVEKLAKQFDPIVPSGDAVRDQKMQQGREALIKQFKPFMTNYEINTPEDMAKFLRQQAGGFGKAPAMAPPSASRVNTRENPRGNLRTMSGVSPTDAGNKPIPELRLGVVAPPATAAPAPSLMPPPSPFTDPRLSTNTRGY